MIRLRIPTLLLAVLIAACGTDRAEAQADAPPPMTEAESSAYQMGFEMTFMCSPERHRSIPESQSLIERAGSDLTGTAAYLRSIEGTFVVLEGYDANQAGHCLVLAWFGEELTPGRYPVRRLSYDALEEEVGAELQSFYVFSAVRAPDESATLVTEAGSVDITSMRGPSVQGSFEVSGFTMSSQERVDGVELRGSFSALEQEP